MRFDGPDRWVVLRLESTSADAPLLSFEYRDDRGGIMSFQLQRGASGTGPVHVDQALRASIDLAAQDGETLPLFLEARSDPLPLFAVADSLVSSFPALADRSRWQLVHSIAPPTTFAPFELPLNILTVGILPVSTLSQFFQHSFVGQAVAAGGLSIANLPPGTSLGSLDIDVVIAKDFEARRILGTARPGLGPRLLIVVPGRLMDGAAPVIWLTEATVAGEDPAAETWKHGAAVISLPQPYNRPDVVDSILMTVVHDRPLHQWLADLLLGSSGPNQPLLVADRHTNHALRMSDAFAAEARRQLESEIGGKTHDPIADAKVPLSRQLGRVQQDLLRVWEPPRPRRRAPGGGGRTIGESMGEILPSHPTQGSPGPLPEPPSPPPLSLSFNFDREVHGLLPLSRARAARAAASSVQQAVPGPLDDVADQRRRVDARLERVERVPDIDRHAPVVEALWVSKDRTLRRGARYRLRVQIGKSFPGNLISDDTPDLLLPPTPDDFWDLDVVVFGKDFALSSAPLLRVKLPKTGASDPVYFDLTAPRAGDLAQLRFGIYLGNQLLQSFRLEAVLAEDELASSNALRVELDLAKSASFGNLETLRPRAFSIGVNDDATPGKHTLLMKVDGLVQDIPLDAAVIADPLRDLRQILQAAAVDGNQPVFPAQNGPLTPEQQTIFEGTIRKLAKVGSDLHDGLFNRPIDKLKERLREIMASPGEPLQFPRFSPNLAVPWPLFYDFTMPEDKSPRVCTGVIDKKPCGHKPGAEVICINGFWGIRHVIEELLRSERRDAPAVVQRPASGPWVRTADGDGAGFCSAMLKTLTARLGNDRATEVDPTQDVLKDVLWNSRPAVMMFLGHLEEATAVDARRIKLPGKPDWLTYADITRASKLNPPWAQPNALVLLMACTAMEMDESTLNDHALAFTGAGAAAVIGPECTIFPAFACRFAEEMILALLDGHKSVGAALTAFRRETVRAGNPLGFAFTVFGDADVKIV